MCICSKEHPCPDCLKEEIRQSDMHHHKKFDKATNMYICSCGRKYEWSWELETCSCKDDFMNLLQKTLK